MKPSARFIALFHFAASLPPWRRMRRTFAPLPAALLLGLALLGTAPANAASWTKNFGTAAAGTQSLALAADALGNAYIAGYFQGATLTLGSVTLNRIGSAGSANAFVAKLDVNGTVLWANNFGGNGAETVAYGVAVDGPSGNVYLSGSFANANLTTPALTRLGSADVIAIKLNSSGSLIWAKNFGGSGATARGKRIAVDGPGGNIYVNGYIQDNNLTTPALTKIGNSDAFALKLDSSGTVIWAKNFGGAGADAYANGIAVDGSNGNVYLAGYYFSAPLTTPALPLTGTGDAFVFKLDSSGTPTWVQHFGGSGARAYAWDVAVDAPNGNVYLAGSFTAANLTAPALTKFGVADGLALKLNAAGAVTWARNFGGSGATAAAENLALDGAGNVYLGGEFESANLSTPAVTRIGATDALMLKLDALSGTTSQVRNFGGSGALAYGLGIAAYGSGTVYLAGEFETAGLTTPALPIIGNSDALIIRDEPVAVALTPTAIPTLSEWGLFLLAGLTALFGWYGRRGRNIM